MGWAVPLGGFQEPGAVGGIAVTASASGNSAAIGLDPIYLSVRTNQQVGGSLRRRTTRSAPARARP